MKPGEKRRNPRRSVTYPAFLDLGDDTPPRECLLCDASQEGALLSVAEPKSLPDEFTLALSVDGLARRRCRVMWRGKDQVGVAYIKAFSAPVRPLDVSHAGAELALQGLTAEPVATEAPQATVQAPEMAEPAAPQPEPSPAADDADVFDIDTLLRA